MPFSSQEPNSELPPDRGVAAQNCDDETQLRPPLDVFSADCLRQRWIGETLLAIARGRMTAEDVQRVVDYLANTHDRRRRLDDDLFFPMLDEHCNSEDNIADLISRLHSTHADNVCSAQSAMAVVKAAAGRQGLCADDERVLIVFAQDILQRAAIMKAALFPIACVRLDDADLTTISDALRELNGDIKNTMTNDRGTQ